MKKVILTSLMVAAAVGAFAQGKVGFKNDSASLVTLTSDTAKVLTADLTQVGTAVGNATPLLSGRVLVAGLYGGATAGALALQGIQPLNTANSAGVIATKSLILTGIAGIASGTAIGANTPYFQVKVWENTYASYELAPDATSYKGIGSVFQMNPGNSIAYVTTAPPSVNTTWVEAPIVVALVPEPTVAAIAGLGLASMLVFRRRK